METAAVVSGTTLGALDCKFKSKYEPSYVFVVFIIITMPPALLFSTSNHKCHSSFVWRRSLQCGREISKLPTWSQESADDLSPSCFSAKTPTDSPSSLTNISTLNTSRNLVSPLRLLFNMTTTVVLLTVPIAEFETAHVSASSSCASLTPFYFLWRTYPKKCLIVLYNDICSETTELLFLL